jgi:hypothetical protein
MNVEIRTEAAQFLSGNTSVVFTFQCGLAFLFGLATEGYCFKLASLGFDWLSLFRPVVS